MANNLMVLRAYKAMTDNLNLKAVAIEFIGDSENRQRIFCRYFK